MARDPTGSPEAVQGIFPLLFVLLFLSTMNLPRTSSRRTGFARSPTYNPISYLVDGMRWLILTGWDEHALACLALADRDPRHLLGLAARGLRKRVLSRT